MNTQFPYLIGRVALTDDWTIDLPYAFKQRFEDRQMVLWRPGFTIWISVWNNDNNEPIAKRKSDLAAHASAGKYNESTTENDGRLYYFYRIDEPSEDGRAPAFQGFAFGDHGHVQLSIYFDQESDVGLASQILCTINNSKPTLDDVTVFSKVCYATNMVMQDGHPVGYMYREEPDTPNDSGWRFFSGKESQDYVDDPSNTKIYPVAFIAQLDRAVIPYLLSSCGHYGRDGDTFCAE